MSSRYAELVDAKLNSNLSQLQRLQPHFHLCCYCYIEPVLPVKSICQNFCSVYLQGSIEILEIGTKGTFLVYSAISQPHIIDHQNLHTNLLTIVRFKEFTVGQVQNCQAFIRSGSDHRHLIIWLQLVRSQNTHRQGAAFIRLHTR